MRMRTFDQFTRLTLTVQQKLIGLWYSFLDVRWYGGDDECHLDKTRIRSDHYQ